MSATRRLSVARVVCVAHPACVLRPARGLVASLAASASAPPETNAGRDMLGSAPLVDSSDRAGTLVHGRSAGRCRKGRSERHTHWPAAKSQEPIIRPPAHPPRAEEHTMKVSSGFTQLGRRLPRTAEAHMGLVNAKAAGSAPEAER